MVMHGSGKEDHTHYNGWFLTSSAAKRMGEGYNASEKYL